MAKKEVLKQGMLVTVKQLRTIANELTKEYKEVLKQIGQTEKDIDNKKHLITIINKTPKCSDTWEIE